MLLRCCANAAPPVQAAAGAAQRRAALQRRRATVVPVSTTTQTGALAKRPTQIAKTKVGPGLEPVKRKSVLIFNRKIKRIQRAKAAGIALEDCRIFEVLAEICMERLSYVVREFPVVLELGCHRGVLTEHYLKSNPPGLQKYIQCDLSREMLDSCRERTRELLPPGVILEQRVVDEDQILPFQRRSVDLIISSLCLHWVNDIEATVKQMRTVLRRDGVLYFSCWGENSLEELQSCFTVAEQERDGGVSPHVNPFLTGPSLGDLFTNCGFNFPTIDIDRFKFYWETPFHLFEWMQLIGEQNCLHGRRNYVPRDTLVATAALYDHLWREEEGVPSGFEVIHGIGWSPHPTHNEPAKRGSGSISLKDIAEALGEEIVEESPDVYQDPGDLSEEERSEHFDKRRAQLEDVLHSKGIRKKQLVKIGELVKRKAKGDEDPEIDAQIIRLRKSIQYQLNPETAQDELRDNLGARPDAFGVLRGGYREMSERMEIAKGGEAREKAMAAMDEREEMEERREERDQAWLKQQLEAGKNTPVTTPLGGKLGPAEGPGTEWEKFKRQWRGAARGLSDDGSAQPKQPEN